MRRKNFIFTAGLIVLLVFLNAAGIPLRQSRLSDFSDAEDVLLSGKVTKMKLLDGGECRMEVRVSRAAGKRILPAEKILLVYDGETDEPWRIFRKTVTFRAQLQRPQGQRNPGCFDYSLYLKSQGIYFQYWTDQVDISEEYFTAADRFASQLIRIRYSFSDLLNPASEGLVAGILFGDTGALSEDVYETFRKNGTAHVLAVSGLHVGILYSLYRKLAGNQYNVVSVSCLVLLLGCYGTAAMWSPSVIRAGMMILLHSAAQALDLRYDMLTGLSTVALVLILQNPYVVFGTGFQMSFLAIASISFFTRIMPSRIPDGITAALAVNLGLALYQMYQFNYVSLVSLVVNVPVIYLTGILVPVSLAALLAFSVLGEIPGIFRILMDSLSFFTVKLNEISSLGGLGSMDAASPPLAAVLVFYFLIFFFSSEQNLILRSRRRILTVMLCTGVGLMGCIALSQLLWCPVSDADLVFVDVGQGDCIHIRSGRNNVLIDGGGSLDYNTGKNTLKPYLLKNGVWNVDLALATHLHMDHFKGLEELQQVYPVKEIKSGLTAGKLISICDDVWIETLWPLEIDPEEGQEDNENCSVFMVHYEGWKVLITGDLDQAGEEQMVSYYRSRGEEERLKAHILKIGHHGSATSTGDLFLDAVDPEYAVIQVSEHNIYGHPSQKTVEKCLKRGIIIKRNDYNGGIGFSFQEDRIQVHTVIP